MTTPQLPPAADAAYLTGALRRAGALNRGAVREVNVLHSRDTIVSRIVRLGLRYSGGPTGAPASLILKIAHSAFAKSLANAGRQEVAFYGQLAPGMPARLVPRCFDGSFDEESLAWHLLLEDLTDTHEVATAWPLPPSAEQSAAVIRALAKFHAVWWDDGRLGESVGVFMSTDDTRSLMEVFAGHFARFADQLGDRLSPDRRDLYRRLIEQSARLFQRYHSRRHVTIAHGDAHVWNFLLPRESVVETARIFDFDQWRINVPTGDLAYMMALQWYPDRRRSLERPLLDCYYDTLIEHGVSGYDRDAFDRDYRQSVLWHITKPVWQWSVNIPPVIWWNNLERVMLAVDDLCCHEFLE